MQAEATAPQLTRSLSPTEIIASLPTGPYTENYQPRYPDPEALADALSEIQTVEPVTTPDHALALRHELGKLALGTSNKPLIITGQCSEKIVPADQYAEIVERTLDERGIVFAALGSATHSLRGLQQDKKPRTKEYETLSNGETVPAYYGDGINGTDPSDRTPDPQRLVASARQAAKLQAALTERIGGHMPAAHEALSLPAEMASLCTDENGDEWLTSADLPWDGERTRDPEGQHVALLSRVQNAVGVKIGPTATSDDIRALHGKLNPTNIPGKLTYMIRTGPNHSEARRDLLAAIVPEDLIIYDIHGVTRSGPDGVKIRCVEEIIADIEGLASDCAAVGRRLAGLNLETTLDQDAFQCTDTPDQLPRDKGGIDPNLNHRQLERVLTAVARLLPHEDKALQGVS